jgi:hypothetical protein
MAVKAEVNATIHLPVPCVVRKFFRLDLDLNVVLRRSECPRLPYHVRRKPDRLTIKKNSCIFKVEVRSNGRRLPDESKPSESDHREVRNTPRHSWTMRNQNRCTQREDDASSANPYRWTPTEIRRESLCRAPMRAKTSAREDVIPKVAGQGGTIAVSARGDVKSCVHQAI